MDTPNPFQAPAAELRSETSLELAGRGERLGAALIDALAVLVVTLPVAWLTGSFDGVMEGKQPGLGLQVLNFVLGVATFLAINGYLLKTYGQTLGKRLLKLAIVDLEGRQPDWIPMIAKRYGVLWVASAIPFAGGLVGLVDALFIFRADRRCVHDLIAETRVVKLRD
ncbi:MAG: RDD family protein [Pseudomonas sp.]|uniref:RDD family protein n=1 Tax=Pseudomonas sp. TaxID=306 RepID=UPI00339B8F95